MLPRSDAVSGATEEDSLRVHAQTHQEYLENLQTVSNQEEVAEGKPRLSEVDVAQMTTALTEPIRTKAEEFRVRAYHLFRFLVVPHPH